MTVTVEFLLELSFCGINKFQPQQIGDVRVFYVETVPVPQTQSRSIRVSVGVIWLSETTTPRDRVSVGVIRLSETSKG
jgi:hypothetical protein